MKLLQFGKDGGPESTVWGYWLCEFKRLFSVLFLCFENGTRDAYHDHAFNAVSWLLRGTLIEEHTNGETIVYLPGWRPIITKRDTFHRVRSVGRSWVFQLRGPWVPFWHEYIPGVGHQTLTDGRVVIE